MTRKINNPLLIQIERHARRAENWRMVKEVSGLILVVLGALLLVFSLFSIFALAEITTGTIVEDNRGPELKRLMESAVK